MPCYSPVRAWRSRTKNENGKYPLVFKCSDGYTDQELQIPCGRCIGCRLERSRQWAVRCVHEASLYKNNCFITLTYDDEHLPPGNTLVKRDFQLFMKRLRKKFGSKIRFYQCGEYGGQTERPHYHACIFNFDFPDKKHYSNTFEGHKIYTSEALAQLWNLGFTTLGAVSFHSAAYVARYITKKITGPTANDHYNGRLPEYCTMSKSIGLDWYKKYHSDLYPDDFVVINGSKQSVPKYYDLQLDKTDPEQLKTLKAIRRQSQVNNPDNTLRRLDVRLDCKLAATQTLKRSIEQ